jgi:hypothetical protein
MTYTWTNGNRYCTADIHRTQNTCPDCENNGTCADCQQPIPDGPQYKYCRENGECIHTGCSPHRAAARWTDYW